MGITPHKRREITQPNDEACRLTTAKVVEAVRGWEDSEPTATSKILRGLITMLSDMAHLGLALRPSLAAQPSGIKALMVCGGFGGRRAIDTTESRRSSDGLRLTIDTKTNL